MFSISEQKIFIDGIEKPLISAEIHPFRLPVENWEKVIKLAKESHCNMIAFYIPWMVYEPIEGEFDFDGITHPSNNLKLWLQLLEKHEMMGFARPGPYAYAELEHLGLPRWILDNYPETKMKKFDQEGNLIDHEIPFSPGHNNKKFKELSENYLRRVMEVIEPYIYPRGNISMIQICNEIPGPDNLDFGFLQNSLDEKTSFFNFIVNKYNDINRFNKVYALNYANFEEIDLFAMSQQKQFFDDHLEYYYTDYYVDYFNFLIGIVSDYNTQDIIITHNAYNPRAISLHKYIKKALPDLFIGVDNYYSLNGNYSPENAAYYAEMGANYLHNILKNPAYIAEQECGFWFDYPLVLPGELTAYYKHCFASGYNAINMYLYAGAVNRPGFGMNATDHNWQAPLDKDGEPTLLYEPIKNALKLYTGQFDIFNAPINYDCGFGFSHKPGLIWRKLSRFTQDTYFFTYQDNLNPKMVDFAEDTIEELLQLPYIIFTSDSVMDEVEQNKICEYIKKGGKVIFIGKLPQFNSLGETCTIIADYLKITQTTHYDEWLWGKRIQLNDGEEIFFDYPTTTYETNLEHNVLAIDYQTKKDLIWTASVDLGKVAVIPAKIDYKMKSQLRILSEIRKEFTIEKPITSNLLRIIPKVVNDGIIYIAINIHGDDITETVTINNQSKKITVNKHDILFFEI